MLPEFFLFAILLVAQMHVDGVLGNIQQIGDLDHRVLDVENPVIISPITIILFLFDGAMDESFITRSRMLRNVDSISSSELSAKFSIARLA